jgi:AraC family L-rhamnose operon regulatory protein RhaS
MLDGFSEGTQFNNTHGQDAYFLRPFTERTEDYHGLIMVYESQYYRINQLLNKIMAELELQGDKDWPCRSRSFFFELLLVLQPLFVDISHHDFEITETPLNSPIALIERIVLYLHTHYHEKVSLSQLSKEFNMNRTSLENLFIKTTSMPVIAYIIRLRLKMAAMILRDTRLPISEIITRVGFNDRAHFTRIFKKNLGISPRDYREKYCQM